MTPLDQAQMLLRKAAQDEALLDSILEDETVSGEIFGYHCQQAAEKLLRTAARALVARVRSFIEPQIKPATS